MAHQSKYYNLNSFPEAERTLYAWMLEQLGSMPREALLALCELPDIRLAFTGDDWQATVPEEEIISALISDFSPAELRAAIVKVRDRR